MRFIIVVLAIITLYLMYCYIQKKHIEPFSDTSVQNACQAPSDPLHPSLNYDKKADVVITDATINGVIDDLLNTGTNEKITSENDKIISGVSKQPFELITRTDQDIMFNELEQKIINAYDNLNIKNGLYKDIERPVIPDALPSLKNATNSQLNPVTNPDIFKDAEHSDLSIWETYDKVTSNNHVNNYDELQPRNISSQYVLGQQYGSKFDNYALS